YSNEVSVEAPAVLGGQCAGEARKKLPDVMPPRVDITLDVRSLTREIWSGRVVTPEGMPVADARVRLASVAPFEDPGCAARTDVSGNTKPDGSFTLPSVPRGKLELDVSHEWYVRRTFDVDTIARPRDLTVDRGATWTGRVLDPEGHVIDRCDV